MILAVATIVQIMLFACLLCAALLAADVILHRIERRLRVAWRQLARAAHARGRAAGHFGNVFPTFPYKSRHL